MATIRASIQVGATKPAERQPVDGKLLHYVQKKAVSGNGWSVKDTDRLVRSGVLNDQSPIPSQRNGDEYANLTEGNVLRPMHAKARDMRTKVVLDGTEFKFTSAKSRDHFVSEMGRWYAENAKADKAPSQAA